MVAAHLAKFAGSLSSWSVGWFLIVTPPASLLRNRLRGRVRRFSVAVKDYMNLKKSLVSGLVAETKLRFMKKDILFVYNQCFGFFFFLE